jgi:hypothetical protein
MRARYLNYFLNHVLTLQDDFATYYVQDPHSSDIPAPGIALKGLRGERQAAGWLQECVGPYNIGIDNMRSFLSDFAPYHYPLYQMDDHQIIDETAKIIMEYGYPIVVKPVFEPPGLQSDFLDHIFEAKNGTLQHTAEIQKLFETKKNPSQKRPEAGQQRKGFQFKSLMRGHHIEAPLDGDAISNVLNLPSAISADIANDVIDFTNAVLAEAQAMQDKGGLEYLKGAAKIQWHANIDWLRHIEEIARKGPTQLMAYLTGDFGKNVEETVRTGPSRLLGYVTGSDMWSDLGKSLSAENWKNAFKLGFYSATFGRLGFKGKASGIRSGAGSGTRTTNTANARQKIKPNTTNALKPTKIDTVKKDAFELDRKNVPKTTTDDSTTTVFRVQGGTPPKASKRLIEIDDDGNPLINKSTLNVSMGDMEHAKHFQKARPGSEIVSFDIPKWMDDFVQEEAIPQLNYKKNPLNQGGLAPKVVDPTTPGRSYELPSIWAEWLEETAIKGSGNVIK